jgi:hypothetical protein
MPDHAAGPRCGGSARRLLGGHLLACAGRADLSGRPLLRELHAILQRFASEARQFEPNALSLLFKPHAQGRSNAITIWSDIRSFDIATSPLRI